MFFVLSPEVEAKPIHLHHSAGQASRGRTEGERVTEGASPSEPSRRLNLVVTDSAQVAAAAATRQHGCMRALAECHVDPTRLRSDCGSAFYDGGFALSQAQGTLLKTVWMAAPWSLGCWWHEGHVVWRHL